MHPEDFGGQPGTPRRQGTVLESVEDIRAQIRGTMTPQVPIRAPATSAGPAEPDSQAFRPCMRPPMALLHVLDDGEDSGEILRIRANSYVIGRVEGNLTIPHDSAMSGQHAEISRRFENGEHCWYLKDLSSTNGTFVRASTILLNHEQELLVGSHRFRFEAPPPSGPAPSIDSMVNATRKLEAMPASRAYAGIQPMLVDISPALSGSRFPLSEQETWIGRDPIQCSVVIDDPMAERKHARVFRDERKRWVIANARSRNGLWARIQEVNLGRGAYFQCGEQRFLFKVI
jgi:pSer/pThr/pTyr-binding forkhead associated (FHA) protein